MKVLNNWEVASPQLKNILPQVTGWDTGSYQIGYLNTDTEEKQRRAAERERRQSTHPTPRAPHA